MEDRKITKPKPTLNPWVSVAMDRSLGGKSAAAMGIEAAIMGPVPTPCNSRMNIKMGQLGYLGQYWCHVNT